MARPVHGAAATSAAPTGGRPHQRPRRAAAAPAALARLLLLALAAAGAAAANTAADLGLALGMQWSTPRICVPGSPCDTSLALSAAPAAGAAGGGGNGTSGAAGLPGAATATVEVDWGDGTPRWASAPFSLAQGAPPFTSEVKHTYTAGLSAGPRPTAVLKLVRARGRPGP
jgi:hypothetical protein